MDVSRIELVELARVNRFGGSSYFGFGLDLELNAREVFLLGHSKIIERLQSDPEFGARAKISRQVQSRIGCDASLATDNLIQPAASTARALARLVDAHAERLQDVLPNGFARRSRRQY